MTTYIYKTFEIRKVTNRDWCVYKDGRQVMGLNGGPVGVAKYERNAFTLKEAKSRIDELN